MLNLIFVFGGLAVGAVLIVENMVSGMVAYVFIDTGGTRLLSLVSIITGIFIGYGLKGVFTDEKVNEDDYNF